MFGVPKQKFCSDSNVLMFWCCCSENQQINLKGGGGLLQLNSLNKWLEERQVSLSSDWSAVWWPEWSPYCSCCSDTTFNKLLLCVLESFGLVDCSVILPTGSFWSFFSKIISSLWPRGQSLAKKKVKKWPLDPFTTSSAPSDLLWSPEQILQDQILQDLILEDLL